MERKLLIEALNSYRLHCGAQAMALRELHDGRWLDWAEKGAQLTDMVAGLKNGRVKVFVQEALDV